MLDLLFNLTSAQASTCTPGIAAGTRRSETGWCGSSPPCISGLAVKWLWFVLGLVLPLLTITGFIMYWNRYLGPRFRSLRTQS